MTAAIYYIPGAYSTDGSQLMGRNAAGESFLRGFFVYGKAREFWVQVQKPEHAARFAETAKAFGRSENVIAVDKHNLPALAQAGAVYCPGPNIGLNAFQRASFGHNAWSLCGITHTTSSAGAMDALADLLVAPIQSWDALICTSTAVKRNVERLVQAQVDYLKERLGVTKLVLPLVPVIPLGIHTQDFVYTDDRRAAARRTLGLDERTIAVLFMGRLSFHAKAHPLAMYQSLESAARRTGKRVALIECGWHATAPIAKAYADAARQVCPSVRLLNLDGRNAEQRQTAWASADIFCSLADNIQETFGITPIEAMAAGLPVVVSDWDGYKDTVRDGVDGFRIPTLMPGAGFGGDLALRHGLEIDNYDEYCGNTSSLVSVDVRAAAEAFERLFSSPELRREMGQAGRSRARASYDWAGIIPQYEALWAQLDEIRVAHGKNQKPSPHPWPTRMDPFHGFAEYPTRQLASSTRLDLVDADVDNAMVRVASYRSLAMVKFAGLVIPDDREIAAVLDAAQSGPQEAGHLVARIPMERQAFVFRGLAWLVKMNILKMAE